MNGWGVMGAVLAGLSTERRVGCVVLLLAALWGYAAVARTLGRFAAEVDAA